ncbi:hypothetical protein COCON_G00208450 [Conger conger]|uniref:Uncharacterized protein n=1 Tax=Conger conger TaxID=82655 RepID=A0A9Q1D099_CONCO|nr:hypothetical protein COCON_G00208450 [Conger conger]
MLLELHRNIGYDANDFQEFPACDDHLGGRWVRFSGLVGDIIPESCVGSCCSGSLHAAYLGFTHPQLGDGIKKGSVHLRSLESCSIDSVDGMRVLACPGGHYVYRLPALSCPATFAVQINECTDDPNICGPNTNCTNTPGSHICTCHHGYRVIISGSMPSTSNPCEGQTIPNTIRIENRSCEINKDLENNPDIVLSEKTVTNVLGTTMSVTENISPDKTKEDQVKTANMVLKISEGLVSALVEPKSQENNTESRKTVKTPTMGSASAVLMSVSGVDKFMSPNFFESENVTEIYSDIITATLPKTKHRELPEPVNFTMFHKKKFQAGLVTCVYWEERGEETRWSVDGCTASFSNENYTVCSCTHLSTFAVLLQTEEQEEDSSLLEVVNLFCMSVGLAFLTLAILTFLLCTWNPKINNTARLHLCICLFLGHLLFLVGVSRTENAVVCAVIAGMLHFLFLSSFVWMLLETLQLFMLVRSLSKVQVIQKEGLRVLYLLLIGYGAPLVVVGVSAAVYSDGYGSKGA